MVISIFQLLTQNIPVDLGYIVFDYLLETDEITSIEDLPESFVKKFANRVNWSTVSTSCSENTLRTFNEYVNWHRVSCRQDLSVNFFRDFIDYIDMKYFTLNNRQLPTTFIRQVKKDLHGNDGWYYISKDLYLSEDFLEEFKDHVVWYKVIETQPHISNKFYKDHIKCFNFSDLHRNRYSDRFLYDFQDCYKLNEEFSLSKYMYINIKYKIIDTISSLFNFLFN